MRANTALRRPTLATIRVLALLQREGHRDDWCAAEVSRRSGLPVSTAIQVLRRLEGWGWVERRWEEAEHAFRRGRPRRHLVGLTQTGRDEAHTLLSGRPTPETAAPALMDGVDASPLRGASEQVDPVTFSTRRTRRGRVASVPGRLWRLPVRDALSEVVLPLHINWSDPARSFDLGQRRERARVYEMVLREGRPADLRAFVDGALLIDLWPDLVLPEDLREAWQPVIREELGRAG